MSDAEEAFLFYLRTLAPDVPTPEREVRFDATRKWRFDFAWIADKVSVEIDGGAYVNGRHNRGRGFESDHEKLNAAQAQGWKVFKFTPQMLKRDPEKCINVFRKFVALPFTVPMRRRPYDATEKWDVPRDCVAVTTERRKPN